MRRLAILAVLAAWTVLGGDLSGIWVGEIPLRNGKMQDIAFKFEQDGAKLTGKLYGDYKSTTITEGTVSGDQVNFILLTSEQAGNQINETRLRFSGTIQADGEIAFTREREGSRNAGNAGGVQTRGNPKQFLRLKRLL